MDYSSTVNFKSLAFAKRIVNLSKYLFKVKKEYVISRQILRSGAGIGANIVEAEYGISRKDFLAKMYIAFKECAETLFWLELLLSGEYIVEKEYISLKRDCDELRKMLSSITKTTKSNS